MVFFFCIIPRAFGRDVHFEKRVTSAHTAEQQAAACTFSYYSAGVCLLYRKVVDHIFSFEKMANRPIAGHKYFRSRSAVRGGINLREIFSEFKLELSPVSNRLEATSFLSFFFNQQVENDKNRTTFCRECVLYYDAVNQTVI